MKWTITETYLYYDWPQLILVKENNTKYLFVNTDWNSFKWVAISDQNLASLEDWKIDVKTILKIWWKTSVYYWEIEFEETIDFSKTEETEFPENRLPEDWLFLNRTEKVSDLNIKVKEIEKEIDRRDSAGLITHRQQTQLDETLTKLKNIKLW